MAGIVVAATLALTWWRLQRGADLVDEAYSMLVPWRWALGDRPFVGDQDLSQAAGLLAYPFVKLFALLGNADVTGLVLYGRHVYLGLCVATAACVLLLARRCLPSPAAVLVAAPMLAIVLFETPQLTANTLCALGLAAGAALGAITVLGGPRRYALASGAVFGLAGVAYPTVLLLAPFVAVFLAFSVGDRVVGLIATIGMPSARMRKTTATGALAWRAVSAWALGGAAVVAPTVAIVVGIAGASQLRRCWDYTLALAHTLHQLGGAAKAVSVAETFAGLLRGQWFIVAAALAALFVFRLRPEVGRRLLFLTPPAVWLTGTVSSMGAGGAVIMYALAAPYFYLFVPERRREDGARVLLWIWAPALLVGAMTAYTSADGLERAAVGLLPGVIASGLFFAWALEPLGRPTTGWAAVVGLAAVVVALAAFQIQFQIGGVGLAELSARMDAGPWQGISLTRAQRSTLNEFAAELAREARAGDGLLVYPQGSAFYLYWPGKITSNAYQLVAPDPSAPLPPATVRYLKRRHEAPTLVVHILPTAGKTLQQLQAESGGLGYTPVLVAPDFTLQRRPLGESVDDVLAQLSAR